MAEYIGFSPKFNLAGGPFLVRNYGINAGETWQQEGDALRLGTTADLIALTAANEDLLGFSLQSVGNFSTGQSDSDELRSYLEVLTTGKHNPVAIAATGQVFLADDVGGTKNNAAVTDIGDGGELEFSSPEWGINVGTTATGGTAQFIIVDIERTRGQYFVLPDETAVGNVFQFIDALV